MNLKASGIIVLDLLGFLSNFRNVGRTEPGRVGFLGGFQCL